MRFMYGVTGAYGNLQPEKRATNIVVSKACEWHGESEWGKISTVSSSARRKSIKGCCQRKSFEEKRDFIYANM